MVLTRFGRVQGLEVHQSMPEVPLHPATNGFAVEKGNIQGERRTNHKLRLWRTT
jgi:hypothetical protein